MGNKVFSLNGDYLGKYERGGWSAGLFFTTGHSFEKFISPDGNIIETDTRTFSIGNFEAEQTKDLSNPFGTTTTTYSYNIIPPFISGIGLFAEFKLKIPFYQKKQ